MLEPKSRYVFFVYGALHDNCHHYFNARNQRSHARADIQKGSGSDKSN